MDTPPPAPKKEKDQRIDRLIELMKSVNGGSMDGAVLANRRACHTMLLRMKRDYPDFDAEKCVEGLIVRGKKLPFHGPNITSFRYLVDHGVKIANALKSSKGGTGAQGANTDEKKRAVFEALARGSARHGTDTGQGH